MNTPTLQQPELEVRASDNLHGRILTIEKAALSPDFAHRTDVAHRVPPSRIEHFLEGLGFSATARRLREVRQGWSFFRQAHEYDAVVTLGDLTGLTVAFLRRVFRRRDVHVMYDCLWYGGRALKRVWMRFCILGVDTCVVWSSIECKRYAKTYRVPEDRFLFVPHHHTSRNYHFQVEDGGYLFTGGNWSRDYALFLDAVREIEFPCILATNRPELLEALEIPKHVRVISATPSEFRRLLARSSFVVLPMQANLLHAGGQQTFLNAMMMGKTVILTDPEGGRDYIVNRETGYLVTYGDVKTLHDVINFLTINPAERQRVGCNARESALPLSTEKCNGTIWTEVLRAVALSTRGEHPKR